MTKLEELEAARNAAFVTYTTKVAALAAAYADAALAAADADAALAAADAALAAADAALADWQGAYDAYQKELNKTKGEL